MKIQEVTIEGYQSHTQSTFRLSTGLTVITGPSDAGKTAIIRALRWLAFNEPTGEAFLHTIRNPDGTVKEAVEQARVTVIFEDGTTITKTRRKGKTSYTHSLYPDGWEKAEIPPEIKETLGLVKQAYGDFETCLNFAFQLDPPFLLSETASVGAKVLGKLAGTEVVDRSISEVNKRTHQTRTDISYADKQIGEIDVSLTEYFDLDIHDKQLTEAEELLTILLKDMERRNALLKLEVSHETAVEREIRYFDEVERLSGVEMARVNLNIAERSQKKAERLRELLDGFWKLVNDQKEPRRVLRLLDYLEESKALLSGTVPVVELLESLKGLLDRYKNTARQIYLLEDSLQDMGTEGMKETLEAVEADNRRLTALNTLSKNYNTVSNAHRHLKVKLEGLELEKGLKGKYEALQGLHDKADNLQQLDNVYKTRELFLNAAKSDVRICTDKVIQAEKELQEAWDAAGGVCPLCGNEVSGCIH